MIPPGTPLTPGTFAALATREDVRRMLPDRVYVGAGVLAAAFSTPVSEIYQGLPVWTLGDSVTRGVGASVVLPRHWRSFDISMLWVNEAAAAGNVRVSIDVAQLGDGDSLPFAHAYSQQVLAAAAQNVLRVSTLKRGVVLNPDKQCVALDVLRFGSDATDTLAGSMGVLGLTFTRRA